MAEYVDKLRAVAWVSEQGEEAIEGFFAEFCADELRGPPKVLRAEGHSFSDVARKVISIIRLSKSGFKRYLITQER